MLVRNAERQWWQTTLHKISILFLGAWQGEWCGKTQESNYYSAVLLNHFVFSWLGRKCFRSWNRRLETPALTHTADSSTKPERWTDLPLSIFPSCLLFSFINILCSPSEDLSSTYKLAYLSHSCRPAPLHNDVPISLQFPRTWTHHHYHFNFHSSLHGNCSGTSHHYCPNYTFLVFLCSSTRTVWTVWCFRKKHGQMYRRIPSCV